MKFISPQLLIILLISAVSFTSCDKEISTTPTDPEPGTGRLVINSNPPGYDIYLGDRISGYITPDTLTFLDAIDYNISLKHILYLDSNFAVDIGDNEEKIININFEDNQHFYATLECETNPSNAEIIIDGNSTGIKTPGNVTGIYPGEHKISFNKLGYRSKEFDIVFESNLSKFLHHNLEDTAIWLVYTKENSQLSSNSLNCVGVNGNNVWVGTYDLGVINMSSLTWENYNTSNSVLPTNRITGIGVGENNKVMIGTESGIAIFNNGTWELVTTGSNSSLSSDNISRIMYYMPGANEQEKFLFATIGGGVIMNQGSGWRIPDNINTNALPSLNTTCIDYYVRFNSSVTYAIGTNDAGVYFYNTWGTNEESIFNKDNSGFITNNITAVAIVDGTRSIYAGAKLSSSTGEATGILYYRNDDMIWEEINLQMSVINDIVVNFSTTWVATNNGLYKLTNRTQVDEQFTVSNSHLESNNIYDIELDLSGNLWLATGHGLVRYCPE